MICPNCKGLGSVTDGPGVLNAGETPPLSITCKDCDGTGEVPPRFFVEFTFDYTLTGRTYWLPLFLLTNDLKKALEISRKTKIALEEKFQNVSNSNPIPEM
jgi:hypothetical protein